MKFSDGGWLFREGFDVKFAVHVYDARKEENKLVLYLPYSYVGHKGATLDGGLLTMEVTTPRSNIIGITLYNYKGVQAKAPDFEKRSLLIFQKTSNHMFFARETCKS